VKTLRVRDLRQRWPEAEALLRTESEIIITRDSRPVAKLVRFSPPRKSRKRFDPTAHGKWQHKLSGGKVARWVDRSLAITRADRGPRSRQA
jgi:antitoxin (DNA-binding transcriptional repressor) of toxin-antitoxin stability system